MKLFATLTAAFALSACMTTPPLRVSPEQALVQRQLEAYNAHDLDGFLATYAPDIELFDLPDAASPTTSGLDAMRNTYGDLFTRLPKLRCDVDNRIADGAFVVDHEVCETGMADGEQLRAIAIYQIENGLIRRVWFAPAD